MKACRPKQSQAGILSLEILLLDKIPTLSANNKVWASLIQIVRQLLFGLNEI